MKVSQIYELMNDTTKEILGEETIVNEDLSNVVDIGKQIISTDNVDNFAKVITNKVGRMVFVDRSYKTTVPSVMMDSWEFGSILEKVDIGLPEAEVNESWELNDRASYECQLFYKPKDISVKQFNNRVTFEIPMSFTDLQVKESFNSAEQMNSFLSMIRTAIENSLSIKIDALIMKTINVAIAETMYNAYNGSGYGDSSKLTAVNLLYLYNERFNQSLTASDCLTDADFIRFAALTMKNYSDRLTRMSTLFNIGGRERFTPKDSQRIVLLSEFKTASDVYLQSNVFHNEFTALPNAESVPYWQGSGASFDFDDITNINIVTPNNHSVDLTGIIGVMFDRYAVAVCNYNQRTTSFYNSKAEFTNNWYKYDGQYLYDANENVVVFFVADATA